MMKIKKIFDLSRPLYHNCPGWPGSDLAEVHKVMYLPHDMCNMEKVSAFTHTGTHADSPLHFFEDAESMDQIDVSTWVGEGVVLDLAHKERKAPITYEDLDKAGKHVKKGDIIAIRTGTDKYYGYNHNYMQDWPAINEDGAKWIVERGVKVVGVDSFGIETFHLPEGMPAKTHLTILGAKICIVEELNLEEIAQYGEKRWLFCWLPILIKGAGGSFVRAIAMDIE
ncbi:MAG: cyclase family protein [Christensenellales bacterium]|jgi:arylformamidase